MRLKSPSPGFIPLHPGSTDSREREDPVVGLRHQQLPFPMIFPSTSAHPPPPRPVPHGSFYTPALETSRGAGRAGAAVAGLAAAGGGGGAGAAAAACSVRRGGGCCGCGARLSGPLQGWGEGTGVLQHCPAVGLGSWKLH